MESITSLSPQALRRAADIRERIDVLQEEFNRILGGEEAPRAAKPRGGRRFSAASRAKMRRAQRARWARARAGRGGGSVTAQPRSKARFASAASARTGGTQGGGRRATSPNAQTGGKRKRRFSPAARARLAASARERWAKAKAEGKSRL